MFCSMEATVFWSSLLEKVELSAYCGFISMFCSMEATVFWSSLLEKVELSLVEILLALDGIDLIKFANTSICVSIDSLCFIEISEFIILLFKIAVISSIELRMEGAKFLRVSFFIEI